MAGQKRGHSTEAAQEFATAHQIIENYFAPSQLPAWQQGYWYDWLFARILLREAAGMIEAKTTVSP